MKANKTPEFRKFLIRELRRISYKWSPKNDALKLAKVSYGKYNCAHCGLVHGRKEIQVDHIEPVVSLEGFKDWDVYIDQLFVDVGGYQVLCKQCHKLKTNTENIQRRILRHTIP